MLSVVTPMHNEVGNVRSLYQDISAALGRLGEPYEIIFVNDASTDKTLSVMKDIQIQDGHFHYADLESNVGENWALLAGISKAAGEIVITIDGDGQNDPAYIPHLLAELSKGRRVVSGLRTGRIGNLWSRRLPSYVANFLIRTISGVRIHDSGCGLKAYRREVLEGKFVPTDIMNRFSPAVFGVRDHEFTEVAIVDRPRPSGNSHYGLGRVFVVSRDLLALPFVLRGVEKWRARFCRLQWISLALALLFLAWRQPTPLLLAGATALLSFSNQTNLRRFFDAQLNPPFRIKDYR